jgi:hypothetical protein
MVDSWVRKGKMSQDRRKYLAAIEITRVAFLTALGETDPQPTIARI